MKQYMVVRTDLKMSKGKIANQVAHASIGASRNLPNHMIEKWMENELQPKIILKVSSIYELLGYFHECEELGFKPYLVTNLTDDKWKDEITCFGVGPCEEGVLSEILGDLKLL